MKETKGAFPAMSGGIKRHAEFIKTIPPSSIKIPPLCGGVFVS
ncbi:MAG: hypothetical protein Q8N65_00230 [bacterium]|nr:hypothetical protein [bacterium]